MSTSSAIGLESSAVSPKQSSSVLSQIERELGKDADSTPGENNLIDTTPTTPGQSSDLKV